MIKKKKVSRFYEYEKKIGKDLHVVLLSQKSKRMRPHFFRNKRTADKRAIKMRKEGYKAKVRSYRKSYVIYFK